MKPQLFIDSFRAIASDFQAFTIKLINRNAPLSHKIEDLSLNLLSFKSQILKCITKVISAQPEPSLLAMIQEQTQQNARKLKKLELHALLKKKIKRLQKQSMIHSIVEQTFNSSFVEDPAISQLRNSMNLIEKDLGIHEQLNEYEQQVSSVIHRSMASLEATPIKNSRLNISDSSMRMQDSYILSENEGANINKTKVNTGVDEEQQKKGTEAKNPSKKKKATVYSSKGAMFDNLLQQSVQTYFSTQKV